MGLSSDEFKEITRKIRQLERDLRFATDEERLGMEDEILKLKAVLENPYEENDVVSEPKKKYKAVYKKGYERRKK